MSDKQSNFNKLFDLLSLTDTQTELVSECLLVKNSELTLIVLIVIERLRRTICTASIKCDMGWRKI